MQHVDQLLREHAHLRSVDYQMLLERARPDPAAHWAELVRRSAPIVHTVAYRLAEGLRDRDALAEAATRQVFEAIQAGDFALVRAFVGYGKWTSLLVLLTHKAPVLAERRREREFPDPAQAWPVGDPDGPIPPLEPQYRELLEREGDRLRAALGKFLLTLHRTDRLLLAMRYEQGLSLRELDHLFRLGSPQRIASLLARLRTHVQPLHAVVVAWGVPPTQHEALARAAFHHLYASRSMATPHEEHTAPALQRR
jgi:hypothetical protein